MSTQTHVPHVASKKVQKKLIDDPTLSLEALGLLITLISLEKEEVTLKEIARLSPASEKKITKLLRNLESKGHVKFDGTIVKLLPYEL